MLAQNFKYTLQPTQNTACRLPAPNLSTTSLRESTSICSAGPEEADWQEISATLPTQHQAASPSHLRMALLRWREGLRGAHSLVCFSAKVSGSLLTPQEWALSNRLHRKWLLSWRALVLTWEGLSLLVLILFSAKRTFSAFQGVGGEGSWTPMHASNLFIL